MSDVDDRPWVTVQEAAEYADVTEDFVNALILHRQIEYYLDDDVWKIIKRSWEDFWGVKPTKHLTISYLHECVNGNDDEEGESSSTERGGFGIGEMSPGIVDEINDILREDESEKED